MRLKKVFALIIIICVLSSAFLLILSGCTKHADYRPPLLSEIQNLAEIQGNGDLYFDWLEVYRPERPTLIVVPGENDDINYRFSMTLDEDIYTMPNKATTTPTSAADPTKVVHPNIGWCAEGFNHDLLYYWTTRSVFNVAVFRWERFAQDSADDCVAKMFSLPKMRYATENGYETARVPNYNLTEIFAALYINEFANKATGREIRLAGNGAGAVLALSLTHYLSTFYKQGSMYVPQEILPARLALCDPYFSVENLNLTIPWANTIAVNNGMTGVADAMLTTINSVGTAVEMIEGLEINTSTGEPSLAYDIVRSAVATEIFKSAVSKTAYLELRESYTTKFPDSYRALKRSMLDWYLYTIVGSDDHTGNAGGEAQIGYPRSLSDFNTYSAYSGFNWGDNRTRPMLNDRQTTNGTGGGGEAGKNFSVSAWTPTVWIRALRGISFTTRQQNAKLTDPVNPEKGTTVHGVSRYQYKPYTLQYFRSESFQMSDQMALAMDRKPSFTLICGYVYADYNRNKYIDDGIGMGVANAEISVVITKQPSTGVTEKVDAFSVYTDETGFYVVRLLDVAVDEENNVVQAGYNFSVSHTVKLTCIPTQRYLFSIADAAKGTYTRVVSGHNFSGYSMDITLRNYYANAITIANCLLFVQ